MLFALTITAIGWAQDRVVERTYLSTDRDVYVAGETLWYSAFCLDAAKSTLSHVSSVAYVELHNAETMVASGKVALVDGRGAGQLSIPNTLPTGNYRLLVYTTQNRAEHGYDFNGLASKTISIFNVFSGERIKDGVEVVSAEQYESLKSPQKPIMTAGNVTLSVDGDSLILENHGDKTALFSLSVTHDDGFVSNHNPSIIDFIEQLSHIGQRSFDNTIIPEYEGEIIRGHISGFSQEMIPELVGKYAFISTPSTYSDVYSSVIDENGRVAFFTGNIYGSHEYICEIEGIDPSLNCFIELESPFVNCEVSIPEKLRMSESLQEALLSRGVAMQIERLFTGDTLLDPLAVHPKELFGDLEVIYVLDDYTRFTTMEEVFVEFVQEMRARRQRDNSQVIEILLNDGTQHYFSSRPTLMLIDGVPVFDQNKIVDYDPLLVEAIHIYPQTYYIGSRLYEGVANFVTYKHNLPGFQFGGNVRVVDFQGVSMPTSFTGEALRGEEDYPDYRQTIYWHPLLTLSPGQTLVIPCKMPYYTGHFKVLLEGLSTDGTPVLAETSFSSEYD